MVDLSKMIAEGARLELEHRDKLEDECSSLSAQNSAQAMRIDELQAEIGRLRLDAQTWWKRVSDLEAENAALRADAERYRWLRDEHDRIDPVGRVVWKKGSSRNTSDWCDLVDGVDLDHHIDAAIDAAMKEPK